MVGDDPQGAPGPELPPYYAQRVDTVARATAISVRRRATRPEVEAQAERLFRDFKLGLVTLVVVALLLVAYFWDGEPERASGAREDEDAVLSIRLAGRPRSEVARAPAGREPVHPSRASGLNDTRPAARGGGAVSGGRSREGNPEARPRVYTVEPGDTLSTIALRAYGNAAQWRAIFDANRARLRRPSDLRSGMRLAIPPKLQPARGPG